MTISDREAIIDFMNSLHHKGYQCDEFGGYTKRRNSVIASILLDELDEEYEHTAEHCRFCKETARIYDRICGE